VAKKRGSDGMPMDVPTVAPKKKGADTNQQPSQSLFGGDIPTAAPPGKGAARPSAPVSPPGAGTLFPDDVPTVPAGKKTTADDKPAAEQSSGADPKTVIHGGRRKKPAGSLAPETSAAEADSSADAMDDPVAGWVVVIEGPGKGQVLKIGYGQNSIGKEIDQRIRLSFGDDQISRQNHAIITYDPRGKQFYLQQGTGTNLAYLNNAPVLAPTQLEANCHISLGETTLRFVPLCGAEFCWQDLEG